MFISGIQTAAMVGLVVFGLCGNIGFPLLAYQTNLNSPRMALLTALELATTMIGPGLMLFSDMIGRDWLERNTLVYRSLMFLSTSSLMSCALVLFALALLSNRFQDNAQTVGIRRQRAGNKEALFLSVAMVTGLCIGIPPLLGLSSFDGLLGPYAHSFYDASRISNYSLFYILGSFLVYFITTVITWKAVRRRQLYPVQLHWQMHRMEMARNDPEATTAASTTDTTNRSRVSSILSGRRSAAISSRNTPMLSRKHSQLSPALEASLSGVMATVFRKSTEVLYPTNQITSPHMVTPLSESVTLTSLSVMGVAREAFVIFSERPSYPPLLTASKKRFKSPRTFPSFTPLQKERFITRFLFYRCALGLVSWLPFLVNTVLQLVIACCTREFHTITQWLIYLPSSMSPLLALCDTSYRRVCLRKAYAFFKVFIRRRKIQVSIHKPFDIELNVENTDGVRLQHDCLTLGEKNK